MCSKEKVMRPKEASKQEIERLTIALRESPDPVELAEVKAHFEGLQKLLKEKDKVKTYWKRS